MFVVVWSLELWLVCLCLVSEFLVTSVISCHVWSSGTTTICMERQSKVVLEMKAVFVACDRQL